MEVSGILVACKPEHMPQVITSLSDLPWADVHFTEPVGRMVVTIEATDHHQSMDRLKTVKGLPRILSAEMVEYRVETPQE